MIATDLFHHTGTNTEKFVRSHKLQPNENVTIFIILSGEKDNIVSILEDHLLESLSSIEWERGGLQSDFTFVTENFNRFLQNIDETDRNFSVVLAVLIDDFLMFSHIGETGITLVEADGSIVNLANNDPTRIEFQAISSGDVNEGTHIYLSNILLETRLSGDVIRDLCHLNPTEWKNIVGDILAKDIPETIHIGHIAHISDIVVPSRSARRQSDILRDAGKQAWKKITESEWKNKAQTRVTNLLSEKKQETKYLFLAIGIILLFTLLYFLFSALFSVVNSPERDTKNQLLQAQQLIDESQKLVSNPGAFNKNIEQAETILFGLRDKRVHIADTQKLLGRIEAMKKEVNDIQTIDVSKLTNIMRFSDTNFQSVGLFERDKRISVIGENGAILGFTRGDTNQKIQGYPTGEKAKSVDVGDDGSFYILTSAGKVLSLRGNEITGVNTDGKLDWMNSKTVKTFNGNVYLASSGSVYRYKPGINGFSAPTALVSNLGPIMDIGVDGGIYILLADGKIIRYIGGNTGGQKNITINKVPGEYTVGSEENTLMVVKQNLSYIYILSGKNIWIFAPNSKRFQDVTAWDYIAQLELQSNDQVLKSIAVPRDGMIDILTSAGVYELNFEIANGKLLLR